MPVTRRELLFFAGGIIAYGTLSQLSGARSMMQSPHHHCEEYTLSMISQSRNQALVKASRRDAVVKAGDDDDDENDGDDGTTKSTGKEAAALLDAKIQERIERRNRRTRPPRGELKLPTPIFLLSLPKSGTTSTHKFFTCGLGNSWASANHWMENATGYKKRVGQCMYENVQNNRDIIEGCGDYKVFTDVGASWVSGPGTPRVASNCYYPSMHGLDAIYKDYPKATIMVVHRNSTEWARSLFTWNNLAGRLSSCPGFPITPYLPMQQTYDNLQEWIDFYDDHTETIRQFAKDHPSLTYVEAALEPDETAEVLRQQTGIQADCWKKCKPESGCVETDQNGNELPPKKVRPAKSDLDFAPHTPGGRLFEKPKPIVALSKLLKVSTPIFVLSLPRSKHIKVYQYFKCGLRKSNNEGSKVRFRTIIANDSEDEPVEFEIGQWMYKNKQKGLSLMEGIDHESILTDMGSFWEDNGKTICYFPSLHDLNGLLSSTASPTFLLLTRSSAMWASELHASMNLMGRLSVVCRDYGFPQTPFLPAERTTEDLQKWADFYEAHTESIRTFAAEHPSLAFIEIDMDEEPGEQLEEEIGITAECWY